MCLYTTFIKNPKYKENKKNKGIVPIPQDNRVLWIPVACNRCRDCMKKKARDWQIRLQEDIKTNKNGKFVTLTFSNESIQELYSDLMEQYDITPEGYDLENKLATLAIKKFLDRWKWHHNGKSLRHWFVTELGHNGTENIHLHGIIWTNEPIENIKKIWKYGFVWPRNSYYQRKTYVNEKTINYCIKYFYKKDEKHTEYRPITLNSPAIGKNYIKTTNALNNQYKPLKTIEYYTTRQGYKIFLPTYYRRKIYSDDEREKLWLEKMNLGIQYIAGYKIDITTNQGLKEYLTVLKNEQKKAKKFGYLDNIIDRKKRNKEEQLRAINLQIRLNNQKSVNRPLSLNLTAKKEKEEYKQLTEKQQIINN